MGDPQLTIGFNTKMIDFLNHLGLVRPWLRKTQKYLDLMISGWFQHTAEIQIGRLMSQILNSPASCNML